MKLTTSLRRNTNFTKDSLEATQLANIKTKAKLFQGVSIEREKKNFC